MRKLFFLMAALAVVLTAGAQGTWKVSEIEADELKGQEASKVLVYSVPEMGSLVLWDWTEYQFRLISESAQFDIDAGYNRFSGSYAGAEVLIGIYSDDGQLVEKFTMWLDKEDNKANRFLRTRNAGTMSNPVGQKGKVKKLFKALQSGTGYVRIVTQRYNTTDFDIKITPYKE